MGLLSGEPATGSPVGRQLGCTAGAPLAVPGVHAEATPHGGSPPAPEHSWALVPCQPGSTLSAAPRPEVSHLLDGLTGPLSHPSSPWCVTGGGLPPGLPHVLTSLLVSTSLHPSPCPGLPPSHPPIFHAARVPVLLKCESCHTLCSHSSRVTRLLRR